MTGPDVTLPQGRREWPVRLSVGMLGSDEVRAYRAERTCRRVRVGYEGGMRPFECSLCHGALPAPGLFCPHCGALVVGDDGE